ncbi:hypothetical protein G6O69_26155 [Pseudenhygromyxa sp. WMMC2535]|uniref:hypothetical protein n=1 Tax=Pseudenhygromyxa sp. WMMC2535 TaxID=2712867 RepID=UPI0015543006|nr:hypothetical protein [Pseudenhygromyxa sp. WMMC2535]NVB41348.1 hypothetical protein [Pseudenhygromyxa sp. WMMC2535]
MNTTTTDSTHAPSPSPAATPPLSPRGLALLPLAGALLRAPERLVGARAAEPGEALDEDERLAALAPKLLALTLIGAGVFGVVLGSYRGQLQYLYAGLKAPLLLLLPMLVGLPAIRAFHGACELQLSWSRLALAALLAVARTAVLAAALAPVLWLYLSLHPGYHAAILAMAMSLAVVGLPGLSTLTRCLPTGGHSRALATFASVAVLAAVLAQSGWLLRPFIVRPRAEISFLRPIEANVFSSLSSTSRSARRDYRRSWDAEAAGFLGRRGASQAEVKP